MLLPELVRTRREAAGLTQEALGEAAGLKRDMIAAIENGRTRGGVETLERLCRAFSLSPEERSEWLSAAAALDEAA